MFGGIREKVNSKELQTVASVSVCVCGGEAWEDESAVYKDELLQQSGTVQIQAAEDLDRGEQSLTQVGETQVQKQVRMRQFLKYTTKALDFCLH